MHIWMYIQDHKWSPEVLMGSACVTTQEQAENRQKEARERSGFSKISSDMINGMPLNLFVRRDNNGVAFITQREEKGNGRITP